MVCLWKSRQAAVRFDVVIIIFSKWLNSAPTIVHFKPKIAKGKKRFNFLSEILNFTTLRVLDSARGLHFQIRSVPLNNYKFGFHIIFFEIYYKFYRLYYYIL